MAMPAAARSPGGDAACRICARPVSLAVGVTRKSSSAGIAACQRAWPRAMSSRARAPIAAAPVKSSGTRDPGAYSRPLLPCETYSFMVGASGATTHIPAAMASSTAMPMPSIGRGAKNTFASASAAAKVLPSADQVLRVRRPACGGAAAGKGAAWPGSGASWMARLSKRVPAVRSKTCSGGMSRRRYHRKPRSVSKSRTGGRAAGSG